MQRLLRAIAHPAYAVRQTPQAFIQRQPTPVGPPLISPWDVFDQLDIVREAQLPLDFYRDPNIRKLTFAERNDLEFQRKLRAIVKLGDFRSERAVPTLIAVLEDKVDAIKRLDPQKKAILQPLTVEAIGKIGGTAALAKLSALLTSKDPKERTMASHGLSETAGGQPVTDLLTALKNEKDAGVKAQIISALGKIGGRSSSNQEKELIAKELIREMESSTGAVQDAAVEALGNVKHKSATEPLMKQLKQHLGIALYVQSIVRALGEIGNGQAVELLVIMLEKHGSKSVRSEAAIALGKIGGSKAMAALKSRLNQEPDAGVRADIAKALAPPVIQWKFP